MSNNEEFTYWEKRGRTYSDLDDIKSKRTAYKLIDFIKTFGINTDSWVLDAGCGVGNITREVRDNLRHSDVVGVDLSKKMISVAKKRERDGLKFFNSDFFSFTKDLDFVFDLVYASLFIHHLTKGNDLKALERMYDILKPNGFVLIAEAIPPSETIFDYYKQIFAVKESRNYYTLPILLKLLRKTGFTDLKFRTYRFDIKLLSWLNDKTLSKSKRDLLYSMHVSASKEFKEAYAMEELLGGDYRLRCKMALVSGKKT